METVKKIKKIKIKKLLIIGLCCLLLGGCGAEEKKAESDEPVTIVVWHYYNGKQKDAFENLMNRFNETVGAEKGILVGAESKGSVDELAEAVLESAEEKVGSDMLPDIAATYVDTALDLHGLELLADIGQYMTEEELASYVPAFLAEGRLQEGGLQVFPVAKSTELFYLNATDWEAFAQETGASETAFETWEGLARVAEQYYRWSGGKPFFGRDAFANYLIVGSGQLGSPVFQVSDAGVTLQLEETVMRRLWECYAIPYLKGYYGAFGRFRSDDVKTGDLIACVASTSSVAYYPAEVTREDGSTYPIDVEVYRLPNFEGTEPCAVQQGAGMAVIRSNEKKERAAVEFLKWFTDVEQNTQFSVETGYFPVKTAAHSKENLENFLLSTGIAEGSLAYDNLLLSSQTVNESILYINKAFKGGADARSVLTNYMTDQLESYAQELQAMISEGMPEEEAWENYITEELFQEWLNNLRTALESVI